jgi:hypothetical protein
MICIELRINEKKELKAQPTQLFYQIMLLNSSMVSPEGKLSNLYRYFLLNSTRTSAANKEFLRIKNEKEKIILR